MSIRCGLIYTCCDLRLGDSRLQSKESATALLNSCDLRLGDSRLQFIERLMTDLVVVICV